MTKHKGLGRGLDALLGGGARTKSDGELAQLAVGSLRPGKYQPRTRMDQASLAELADSIRARGILQPVVVRPVDDGGYEILAGERRWRAAQLAGLDRVPALVREVPDDAALGIGLIENIQREDLNPIEVAEAFDRLCREMGMSHEEIAKRTGKDRSTVTNMIRLLRLPEQVQVLLAERKLSMGHARAILGVEKPELQLSLADKAAAEGMSVRQVERAVQKLNEEREPTEPKAGPKLDPNVKAAVEELERFLGTRVKIEQKGQGRGKIEIEFYSMEDLDRIYSLVVREENE